MKPLFVLISVFVISAILIHLSKSKKYTLLHAGRLSMGIMLIFTGIAHFTFTKGMAAMLPDIVPQKQTVIYITGLLEILGAIGLLLKPTMKFSGIMLVIFLIASLPSNIYAALNNINPLTGENNGPGLSYLWFRIPLQLLFLLWIYYFSIRKHKNAKV